MRFFRAFHPRHRFLRDIVPEKKLTSLLNIGQATLGKMSRKTRQLASPVPILGKSRMKRTRESRKHGNRVPLKSSAI